MIVNVLLLKPSFNMLICYKFKQIILYLDGYTSRVLYDISFAWYLVLITTLMNAVGSDTIKPVLH